MMQRLLYFAYGSNLLIDRLEARVGKVEVFGKYNLVDYELYITPRGYADIRPNKGNIVEGILYILTPTQHKRLDMFEAFYEKQHFIIDSEIACVYIENMSLYHYHLDRLPTPDYLNCIIQGAINFGLVNLAKQMDSYKIKTLKLKKYKKFNYEGK